ncbi:MAG: 4-phosphopantetheinyl transferase family protein [Archangium sp.]|nr:4-phosphopantetheinyl transferase family protein [Archangium sp.]
MGLARSRSTVEPPSSAPPAAAATNAFAPSRPAELAGWQLAPELQSGRTAIAWAAKEAVLKVWGVGLRAPLGLVVLRPGALARADGDFWRFTLQVEGRPTRLDAAVALPSRHGARHRGEPLPPARPSRGSLLCQKQSKRGLQPGLGAFSRAAA